MSLLLVNCPFKHFDSEIMLNIVSLNKISLDIMEHTTSNCYFIDIFNDITEQELQTYTDFTIIERFLWVL